MEYESFRALGYEHTQTRIRPNYVTAEAEKPATWEDLYPLAEDGGARRLLKKEDKLFWRTRHRLEFRIELCLKDRAIVVSTIDTEAEGRPSWRPIVVDLQVLFPIIDEKKLANGTMEKKSKKEGSGLDPEKLGNIAVQVRSGAAFHHINDNHHVCLSYHIHSRLTYFPMTDTAHAHPTAQICSHG